MNDISTTTCKYNAEVKKVGYTDLGNTSTHSTSEGSGHVKNLALLNLQIKCS